MEANEDELGSDEEYEIVEEDEDDGDVVPSGTTLQAPSEALARRKEVEELGTETTTFHGESEIRLSGRSYLHVPQDLDIDLDKEGRLDHQLHPEEAGLYMEASLDGHHNPASISEIQPSWLVRLCRLYREDIRHLSPEGAVANLLVIPRRLRILISTWTVPGSYPAAGTGI